MELMFSMLLLGCSHDLQMCESFSMQQELYASRHACEDVIPLALHAPEGYPMVTAKCVPLTHPDHLETRIDVALTTAEDVQPRVVQLFDYAQISLQQEVGS